MRVKAIAIALPEAHCSPSLFLLLLSSSEGSCCAQICRPRPNDYDQAQSSKVLSSVLNSPYSAPWRSLDRRRLPAPVCLRTPKPRPSAKRTFFRGCSSRWIETRYRKLQTSEKAFLKGSCEYGVILRLFGKGVGWRKTRSASQEARPSVRNPPFRSMR